MTIRSFRRAHARRVARERRRLTTGTRRVLVAGATLGASAVFASSAQAAGTTYTVTGTGDTGSCTGTSCPSLRAAVTAANGDSGNDTIQFASSLKNATIGLSSHSPLTISKPTGNLVIQNPDAPGLGVSGEGSTEVFDITAPKGSLISISGLTIEDGFTNSGGGGAIYNSASTLTLTNDVVSGSDANDGVGGGVDSYGPLTVSASTITGNSAFLYGGGIFAKYGVKVVNSTISLNGAKYGGGGIANWQEGSGRPGAISISGSQITFNDTKLAEFSLSPVPPLGGGGILNFLGSLSMSDSVVSGNITDTFGGGIISFMKYGGGTTITDSTLASNAATKYGGGLSFADVNISGAKTHPAAHGMVAAGDAALAAANRAQPHAVSPANPVSISGTTFDKNTSAHGAGIDVGNAPPGSPVTISTSTLSRNSGGPNSSGGGMLIEGDLASAFKLIDSTISGNSATDGGGVTLGSPYGEPLVETGGSVAFDNSTVASNTASSADGGGGIFLSDYLAGSPSAEHSGAATIFSTIVGANKAGGTENDLEQAATTPTGGFTESYSLIEQPGNSKALSKQAVINGLDPQLGALGNNGGLTQTMLPAFTSPVIDQGKNSLALSTDQRGDPRTVNEGKPRPAGGDGTDIGAVEVRIPLTDTTHHASDVMGSSAKLHGTINTNGQAVTWYFEWGKTKSYGHKTATRSIGSGHGVVSVSAKLSGLAEGTRYHFQVVAVSGSGTKAKGGDRKFKTPSIQVNPGTVMPGNSVRLSGSSGICPAGDRVTLISSAFSDQHTFNGKPAVYATAMSNGKYSTNTTIPSSRSAGRYTVTGRCGGANFGVSADLIVAGPPKFTG